MASYHVIGGDTKEYGPIWAEDIRSWIAEGRLNGQSLAKGEGETAWRTLGSFPEFAAALKLAAPLTMTPPPVPSMGGGPASRNFLEQDYELDIGGCVTRGWDLIKENMGVFFVGPLIYLLIVGGINLMGNIPLIGAVFSIVNFIISGPFMGGVLYLLLRGVRGEPAEVGDIFLGFKRAFGQLFLATLVQAVLLGVCMAPFIVVFAVKAVGLGLHYDPQSLQSDPAAAQEFVRKILAVLMATSPVLLVCVIPAIYLSTCWKFSLPLIMDKDMGFWTAMMTSFKMVNKHWWQVFGLLLVIGLLNVAGFMACCVGLLFSVPVGFAALMYAYETIFGSEKK